MFPTNNNGGTDIEGNSCPIQLESLEASLGWFPLPKVKLATWDPDDEKQWTVSTAIGWKWFQSSCIFTNLTMANMFLFLVMVQVQGGEKIATRNLLVGTPTLLVAFVVWLSWSVIVIKIQQMHDRDPVRNRMW